jgi:hypothetical protein
MEVHVALRLGAQPARPPAAPAPAPALQAAGLLENEGARAEAAVLQEVSNILADVQDVSWPSGRPENS